jgi:hypothetical protein
MSPVERTLVWSGEGGWGAWHAELARVALSEEGIRGRGVQLGIDPLPYRLDYTLDATGEGAATRSLRAEASGAGWERRLRLERSDDGEWAVEVGGEGEIDLPAPGGDEESLAGAVDCDLGFSPLTNAMPVRRHNLHRRPGQADLVMAWVSVPDLSVHAMAQRYTHLGDAAEEGAIVRYESLEDGEVVFTAELELDRDGLVRIYPGLGRRVE